MLRLAKFAFLALALAVAGHLGASMPEPAGKLSLGASLPPVIGAPVAAAPVASVVRHGGPVRIAGIENDGPVESTIAPIAGLSATDDRGDDELAVAHDSAGAPRDQAFLAEFNTDQKYSTAPFFAPLATGPPAA